MRSSVLLASGRRIADEFRVFPDVLRSDQPQVPIAALVQGRESDLLDAPRVGAQPDPCVTACSTLC